MTRKLIWLLAVLATATYAQDNCVIQEKSVSAAQVVIQERSPVRRDIVPAGAGDKRCMVDFKVRIGSSWYTAFGEHTWPGDVSSNEACGIAVARAEDAVKQRVGKSQTQSERTVICKDRPELATFRSAQIGTIGDIAQFRPHPDYPNRFWHNGAQCRWFLDSAFVNRNVRTYQGIICEIQPTKWVVVDKF